jgi:hypothetical protein
MLRSVLGITAVSVALAGCGNLGDRLSARSDVAAQAGSHTLSSERVATILAESGGGPTIQAAEFVSNIWLDYSVFAEAVATGRLPADSAAIARVMWPEIAQTRVRLWHDSVMKTLAVVPPGAVDSVYRAGDVRLFQHIITIPTGPTAADTQAAQRAIRQALARVKGGADFGAVAAEVSADGSKQDMGYLGVGPRGQFVPEFEEAAWQLAPGQVSDVVPSQFGWHIIRRPTLEESRVRFEQHVRQALAQKADSAYFEGLAARHGLKVSTGAPAAMRAAVVDPAGHRRSGKTLVELAGDDLTVADFVKWISPFPLNTLMQIKNANDTLLLQYAKNLAHTTLVLRQADSAGFHLTPAQWQFVELKYSNSVDGVRRDLGLEVPEFSDSSNLSPDQRSKLAAEKVENYFTRLLTGQAQMQLVLPQLAAELRAEKLGRVNQAGIARALELASAQFRRDSAAAAAARGGPPVPGLAPAPGGPPVDDTSGR